MLQSTDVCRVLLSNGKYNIVFFYHVIHPLSSIFILFILLKEKIFPKFLTKEMEGMFIEELRASVNLLMANLESLPVSKGGPEFKLQKLKRSQNTAFLEIGDESEVQLSKSDVVLSFTLEVCLLCPLKRL